MTSSTQSNGEPTETTNVQTNGTRPAGDAESSDAYSNIAGKEGEQPISCSIVALEMRAQPTSEATGDIAREEVGQPTSAVAGGGEAVSNPGSDDEAFIEALRAEVNRWTLPSHLWWAAWAVVQAKYSPIDFDFVDYARLRLAGYRLHKEAFF